MQVGYNDLCTQLIMYEDTWLKSNSSAGSENQSVEAALNVTQRREYGGRNKNNNYNCKDNRAQCST